MSNDNVNKSSSVESMTEDLRQNDWKPKVIPVQTKAPVTTSPHSESALTPAQILEISKIAQQQVKETIKNSSFNPDLPGQSILKNKVPIVDFSKLSIDDVYDMSIPIEAKAFMSADVLKIELKDTNYEARWVNVNPQNLGDKIAKGFTYIVPADLVSENAIQTALDASGHYRFNDVVAMKIDKATYMRALRAAHERAIATTDQANARKRAARTAEGYMQKESGFANDFNSANANKKMVFYDPGVEV